MKKFLILCVVLVFTSTSVFAMGLFNRTKDKVAKVVEEEVKAEVKPVTDVISSLEQAKVLWAKYYDLKDLRDQAISVKDNKVTLKNLFEMTTVLRSITKLPLPTEQLALANNNLAWQLNNVGFYVIQEFKLITDYQAAQDAIADESDPAKKRALIAKLKKVCKKDLNFLRDAKPSLVAAKGIDEQGPWKDTKARTKLTDSNLMFIDWVENFCAE